MRELILVLKAAADPMRIVKMLERKRMCVCELTAVLGIQQSSVSHHLRILKDAGLVDDFRNGPWIDYALTKKRHNDYAPDVLKKLSSWLNEDTEIEGDLKKARKADRKELCKT